MEKLKRKPELLFAWTWFLGACFGIGFLLIAGMPLLVEIMEVIQYQFDELNRMAADPYNFV